MKGVTIFILFVSTLVSTFVVCDDFENHKIITLHLKTEDQEKSLVEYCKTQKIEIVVGPSVRLPTNVLIAGDKLPAFEKFMGEKQIKYKVGKKNVKQLVKEEEDSNKKAVLKNKFRAKGAGGIVGTYARINDIYRWMMKLSHKNRISTIFNIGLTYEKRPMLMLKVSTGPNRQIIFMDAGIHAREWIAPATLIYFIQTLLQDYKRKDPAVVELLSKYDFYFLPSVNPDGYEFSHNNASTRFWRKTRQPFGKKCHGADPNRNFDVKFGTTGVEFDPCSDVYCGPKAFSEVEARNFRDFVWPIRKRIKMYISLHAYSKLWFTPYGYAVVYPPDIDELNRVAKIGADALFKVHGNRFQVGSPAKIMYPSSGGSDDWMKANAGVKYVYTLELRPKADENGAGFLIPASEIIPSGQEVYAGVKAAALAMK